MPVLTESDVKMFHGFEVEKSMKLTPWTKKLLRKLSKTDICLFSTDDSLDSYETLEQLGEIAGNIGLTLVSLSSYNHILVCPDKKYYVELD